MSDTPSTPEKQHKFVPSRNLGVCDALIPDIRFGGMKRCHEFRDAPIHRHTRPAEPVDWYCLRCKKTFRALMHVCPDCKGSDTRLVSAPQPTEEAEGETPLTVEWIKGWPGVNGWYWMRNFRHYRPLPVEISEVGLSMMFSIGLFTRYEMEDAEFYPISLPQTCKWTKLRSGFFNPTCINNKTRLRTIADDEKFCSFCGKVISDER